MTELRRILYPLTAAVILAYFLFFTWKSLHMYFDSDDMNALYFGWSKPMGQLVRENLYLWKGAYRPLGQLFYRGVFAVAGFNPLPFRIAALGVCLINTAICFWFTRLISASERTAALATLLFAFQARMVEVWFRTTVIFDSLCFMFVVLAAGIYIKGRRDGGDVNAWRIAAILLCFLGALNTKEFAVCLPVFLVAWEIVFNGSKLNTAEAPTRGARQFLKSRATALIAVLGVLTLVYMYAKLHGPAALNTNPLYDTEYSYARFTATWNEYLRDIFVLPVMPLGWVSVTILGGLLAVALAARSRILLYAWVILFFGMLPVSFVPPRGGYEILLSYLGWVLYAAALLVALQDFITRGMAHRGPRYRTALACAVFVLVGWRWGKINLHNLRFEPRPWLYESPAEVRAMAEQLSAMHPEFPPHTRVLFIEDGFTTGEWTPMFLMRLLYEDREMVVDRIKAKTVHPPGWEQYTSADRVHYDHVFTYEDGRYREVRPAVEAGAGTGRAPALN